MYPFLLLGHRDGGHAHCSEGIGGQVSDDCQGGSVHRNQAFRHLCGHVERQRSKSERADDGLARAAR